MAKIAFLGLGVMGAPMAGHLVAAGHAVTVWNRSTDKAAAWGEMYPGQVADSVGNAVKGAEVVAMCLGDSPDVITVVEAMLGDLSKGAIVIDHTTASPACARQCAQMLDDVGAHFVDAPISGGEAGAVNGQLTVMCGADAQTYAAAEPVMAAYAKSTTLMGEVGAGQTTKIVNQLCIAGTLLGLSEGVLFARSAGLDVERVVDCLQHGAAGSWQMVNRSATMSAGEFDFGFALDWMRKDLRIAMEAAREEGLDFQTAKRADIMYAQLQEDGRGRQDTSAIVSVVERESRS